MSGIAFEPGNPRAAAIAERLADRFVEIFGDPLGRDLLPILVNALLAGHGTRKAAVPLREFVGSSQRQKVAVGRYRRHLESGSPRALRHPLRDRRADVAVRKAVEGKTIPWERIDRLCVAMDARMTTVRAEHVMHEAIGICVAISRRDAMIESCRQAGLRLSQVKKTWRAVDDHRSKPLERELNGIEVDFEQPFTTSTGVEIMFPDDPDGPRSTRMGFRSTVTHRIVLD